MSTTSIGQPGNAGANERTAADPESQKTLGESPAVARGPDDRHAHTEDLLIQKLEQHQQRDKPMP